MSRIDDLRALHEAASTDSAEWHVHEWGESRRRPSPVTEVWACFDPDHSSADGVATEYGVDPDAADFIVAAHKVWPALLDVASAAEEVLDARSALRVEHAWASQANDAWDRFTGAFATLRAALDRLNTAAAPATAAGVGSGDVPARHTSPEPQT